ncbi:MAG TPA: ATP phosphoribosyltransferase, partial [Actinobacteria bacterium]|nr:ATP phosphoribosyltransferase [Actinomycetota bacterium]
MLSIALPKGSLEEQTFMLFAQADLPIKKGRRQYNSIADDPRIDKIKILRPQEIPKYVEEGYFDLGISGKDCIVESGANVIEVADMPYAKTGTGKMKMIIAVPDDSIIEKPEDILVNSRVTTEFPNITKAYFDKLGIPVKVYYSYGATEAKIPEIMDVVVDLTETGETLRRNQLKIIGTVMESTTRLIANKDSWENEEKRKAIEEIKTLLLGV